MEVRGGLQRLVENIPTNHGKLRRLDYARLLLPLWGLFSIHFSSSFPAQFFQMLAGDSNGCSVPNTPVPRGFQSSGGGDSLEPSPHGPRL